MKWNVPRGQALVKCQLLAVSLGLMMLVVAGAWSPALSAATAADFVKLHKGLVVVKEMPAKTKDALPSVSAQILINRPASELWQKILVPEHLMDNEKKVKSIKVVAKNGSSKDISYTVVMSKLLPTFNYVLRHQVTQSQTMSFWRVSGSFKDVQGSWTVTPGDTPKTSVLTYNISIDPGPLVPRFLLQSVLKADLPNMMNNVKGVVSAP